MLTRIRSGCHWLQVSEGRYSDVPREMRFCPNCPSVVEDEGHFLIKYPAYSCIREKFEHSKLHSYADVAKLFKEYSDYFPGKSQYSQEEPREGPRRSPHPHVTNRTLLPHLEDQSFR
jgi:hypothetical protein